MLREPLTSDEIGAINENVRGYAISVNDRTEVASTLGVTTGTVTRWFSPDLAQARNVIRTNQAGVEWWQKSVDIQRREILGRIIAGEGVMDVATRMTGEEKQSPSYWIVSDLGQAIRIMRSIVNGDEEFWFQMGCSRIEMISAAGGGYIIHVWYRNAGPNDEQSPQPVGEAGGEQYGLPGDVNFDSGAPGDDL